MGSVGLPSRRALREQAHAGSLTLPSDPPMSRRERRLRETLEATGSLSLPFEPSAESTPTGTPAFASPESPLSAPVNVISSNPPLTRRQLRDQLRLPPTDSLGSVHAPQPGAGVGQPLGGDSDSELPGQPAPVSVTRVLNEETTRQPQWDSLLVDDDAAASTGSTPVTTITGSTALPPVFAMPASTRDDSELALSRSVGPTAPATNALILPVAPPMDMTGPIGDTGEVLVTGNIPLPKYVVETGITGVVDVDDDDDFVEADSGAYTQPIRADQAVSSRSLELDAPMIKKPRWGAVSLALAISAAVLGVTAVSLLALALLTDIVQLPF